MISLDCEATGLDIRHGAKPYLVTICNEGGVNTWWEWDVDPLTREPDISREDLLAIQEVIDNADKLVLQNPKFDVAALQSIFKGGLRWDWDKVYDTLLAGHLLASNQPHDLTTMVMVYLNLNVQPYEDAIEKATKEARGLARKWYKDWRIASKELLEMPSAKQKVWKYDMWLPVAIAIEENYAEDHSWWSLCAEYANSDSASTLALFGRQRELLEERGLWKIYLERLKILSVLHKMENRGITSNRPRLEEQRVTYQKESEKAGRTCVEIAEGYDYKLVLPKSGNNNSLLEFVFGAWEERECLDCYGSGQQERSPGVKLKRGVKAIRCDSCGGDGKKQVWIARGLRLPAVKRSQKTGNPSLDKQCMDEYLTTLKGKQLRFIEALAAKRKRDTALNYLDGYERFWLPILGLPMGRDHYDWFRLHPSVNPTGTDTLRMSSANPNEQNISNQEDFNLRYVFGPAPGREWWSLDYDNIELRIPGYESGERAMIDVFEKADKPPYYGSYHLLICHLLHPKRFDKCVADGVSFKDRYKSTWYSWTKNFNFADQYGAMESSGTADRAAHVKGAQRLVNGRLKQKSKLNQKWIDFAEKHGYVETMPDKEVDPERGYPLLCSRSRWGKIMSTIPLNYHVQGTACWVMMRAMIKVQAYLDRLNEKAGYEDYFIIMNVHDEIVLDLPKGKKQNLPKVKKIRQLMESIGDAISVPLTCGIDYHPNNWSEGVSITGKTTNLLKRL